jgi:hypothetical protein
MPNQRTLQWLAEDPARLQSLGDPMHWMTEGMTPEEAQETAQWGQKLGPLGSVQDPEVRRNMLYQQLLEMQKGGDPLAGQFLEAYGGDTGMLQRLTQGFTRGLVEGAGTPLAAEALAVDRGLTSGEWNDANTIGNIAGNVVGFGIPAG